MDYGNVTAVRAERNPPTYGRPVIGYASKLPSRYWVQLDNETRWRRVYVLAYGNAGTPFVVVKGADVFLRESDLFDV